MKQVVVQGLGFVGLAMSIAIASSSDQKGSPLYDVIGLDLPSKEGYKKVNSINNGQLPLKSSDKALEAEFYKCIKQKNLSASTDPKIISNADYVIVDINLDVNLQEKKGNINFEGFSNAISTVGEYISEDTLVIIETTVPPGTTEKIAYPILFEKLQKRFPNIKEVLLAHSYERVMPGPDYYNSIKNFWRVFAGCNRESSLRCKDFLKTIINTEKYKMMELKKPSASETAKIMENSFRALNIAFIDEWSNFAKLIGINLFEVIDAIRVRPTHKNIMEPGLGVGGYCLTKDPLMGKISLEQIYGESLNFPLSELSVKINKKMPNNTSALIKNNLKNYQNKKILIMGITYREDVGDLRFSPSEDLIKKLLKDNLSIDCFDPMVDYTSCEGAKFLVDLPIANNYDAIVFTVKHSKFKDIDLKSWLNNFKGIIIDANHILSDNKIAELSNIGIKIKAIGRGDL